VASAITAAGGQPVVLVIADDEASVSALRDVAPLVPGDTRP
jgi:hypothetical protein